MNYRFALTALLLLVLGPPLLAQDTVRAVNHSDTLRLPYWSPGDPGGCFSAPLQGSTQRHVACWPATVIVVVTKPGTVSDLTVAVAADSSLTLRFTEVAGGTGQPASYFVRIAKSPLSWGGTPDVSRGTCASPFAGTAIGATRSCTITGLVPATKYDAQLVAFRGVPNTTSTVFGALSNVATGTTTSSVVGLPPPPPPVAGTHEPAGLTLLADYDFSDLFPVQADGVLGTSGWGIVNPQGRAIRGLDAAPPTVSAFVGDFIYPVGFPEGSAPATLYKTGFSVGELYAGFWWKPSNPWQNETAGVNKIAFMVTTPGGAFIGDILAMVPGATGPYLRLGNEINQPSSNYEPNVTKTPITLGQWHFVEWWMRGSGGLRWWLDGVLQGDYPNYTVPNPFTMFQFSPTWGGFGAGDMKTETDHYWFNHVRLSGGSGVSTTGGGVPPTFATPDLLNNASFETGWDGFHNLVGSTGDPASLGSSVGLTSITRSQDHAHAGLWSAKSGFSANPGSDEAINMQYDFGARSHVFVRVWFYATATPTNAHKWIRFYDANGSNAMGVENERSWAGAISWVFNNSTGCVNCGNLIGVGVATLNTWHSLEIDYDAGNGRVRFYYDGTLTTPVVNNPGSVTVDPVNGWLTSAGGPTASPRYLVFDDTYNAGNTASGAFYYDQVAISTQRIGP